MMPPVETSFAKDNPREGKNFAIDVGTGVPLMIGPELSYIGLGPLAFGFGFGSFPINSILQSRVSLDPVAVAGADATTLELVPTTSFRLYSTSVFARVFPWRSGLFAQLGYALWTFQGSLKASLQNEALGTSIDDVLTGSLTLRMPSVSTMIGYQLMFSPGLFFDFGLGLGILLKPRYSFNLGGTAVDLASLVPDAAAELEDAKANISSQVDGAMAKIESTLKYLPNVVISVGWAF